MKIVDNGVTGASFMDFMIPTEFARKALYYCPQFGHFYGDNRYRVVREPLDLFLLMYVRSGTLWVETQGRTHSARAGEAVLLDCRRPHAYYCQDRLNFLWIHFYGNSSAAYVDYLSPHHQHLPRKLWLYRKAHRSLLHVPLQRHRLQRHKSPLSASGVNWLSGRRFAAGIIYETEDPYTNADLAYYTKRQGRP